MNDVSLIKLLEDKGVQFLSGGGNLDDDGISIDFMYSDPSAPGVVAAAKIWVADGTDLDDLFGEAVGWFDEGFAHIFEMSEADINNCLKPLLDPLFEQAVSGATSQRLTVNPKDDFWTFAAFVRDGDKMVLWAAFGAQNLTVDVVKEVAHAFAVAHLLDKQEPVLH